MDGLPVSVIKYGPKGEKSLDAYAYALADMPYEEQPAGICVSITTKKGGIEVTLPEPALIEALKRIYDFRAGACTVADPTVGGR